jgi:outer membrane biosynthesis protein TonB
MSEREVSGSRNVAPFTLSAILHAALLTLLFNSLKQPKRVALPPMYRVNIVAAPPGERAIGEVQPPAAKPAAPVTPPSAAQSSPKAVPVPQPNVKAPSAAVRPKTDVKSVARSKANPATPTDAKATGAKAGTSEAAAPPKTEAPKAGGGPTGGKGTDVATVRSDGIEFPFPGYLNNIVRQIALNFKPRNADARLKAEVRFLIHRDGSVSDLTFVRRSGVFSFDLEAQGAVEAASSARGFGPLPGGFPDDVLPVVFSFDPTFLK